MEERGDFGSSLSVLSLTFSVGGVNLSFEGEALKGGGVGLVGEF